MATSGSTGSPRLVRLARTSLDANAAAIADYLDIRPTDRAVTTLPLHYCYGLSVVHSNLLAGAALVLTDASVTEPAFWDLVRTHRATSLHGVRTASRCSSGPASQRWTCRTCATSPRPAGASPRTGCATGRAWARSAAGASS